MVDMTARGTLHPIMFLLNPDAKTITGSVNDNFTSHYVPIKLKMCCVSAGSQ